MTRLLNTPTETLSGTGTTLHNTSLFDFWQWAFRDLCDDDIKGIFAEWIVMKLIGLTSARRVSWANSDLITSEGVRIEVKSTAYWQSWKILDDLGNPRPSPLHEIRADSQIRFGGLTARDSANLPTANAERDLKSDLYIFAFQHEKNLELWNAMNLSQWEFYVLPASKLRELRWRTISLLVLRSVATMLSADTLGAEVNRLISISSELSTRIDPSTETANS